MTEEPMHIRDDRAQQSAERGYNGRILHVDLGTREIKVEQPDDAFYRTYVGGRALATCYMLRQVPRGADPLGPDNALVFAPGVVTGTGVLGSGRHGIGAKSPLTGGLGSSEAGGWWGAEFKRAGFDALVVNGQASEPVYLWINDGQAEIRPASHLWGRTTAEVQEAIRAEIGDSRVRVAQAGPAGERLVRYAAVINNANRAAGRTGLGAVMGSKRLKAVAVRGRFPLSVADKQRVRAVNKWLAENFRILPRTCFQIKAGTGGDLRGLNDLGALPTRNFQDPQFAHPEAISNSPHMDSLIVARDNCDSCPVHCKVVAEMNEGEGEYVVDRAYGGPEYETLAAFGSDCGVDDYRAILKANELCNAYGLDTISTGATIAFAMECFEKGLLTVADTDGLELRFGDAQAMVKAVEMIATRTGFGDRLAQGSAALAQLIGRGADQLAMHVKGQEVPMHEPRARFAFGVGYAVSPTGADHNHNSFDQGLASPGNDIDNISVFGPVEPMSPYDLSLDKMRAFSYITNFKHALDCAVICIFMPYHYTHIAEAISGVTGWDFTVDDVLALGKRAATLGRLFNLRDGFTVADDKLPRRLVGAFKEGPLAGKAPTREAFAQARSMYYEIMGWDPHTGIPTRATLHTLGIGEFAYILD
jgi:aldehyde:ferredoxin oxidoreductase